MTIVTRLVRLVRPDVNAVLDRIEEPGILLQQAVQTDRGPPCIDRSHAVRIDGYLISLLVADCLVTDNDSDEAFVTNHKYPSTNTVVSW